RDRAGAVMAERLPERLQDSVIAKY
ncbi:MAG: hypothetical protein RLZZ169_1240, partial [Pseudomonadota bacterium]